MKKIIKILIFLIGAFFILYNSIYFRPLDEVRAEAAENVFDAKNYAEDFWQNKLLPNLDGAIDIDTLLALLDEEPDLAYDQYSDALGIGNIRFFLISGTGHTMEVNEDHVLLKSSQGSTLKLATDYIFGNAIRDASGQMDINEFVNTMDFNNVSAEINEIVVQSALPEFKTNIKSGDIVIFHGAIELNRTHPTPNQLEIIPIRLTIQSSEAP
jgi:predicted lipoprotein